MPRRTRTRSGATARSGRCSRPSGRARCPMPAWSWPTTRAASAATRRSTTHGTTCRCWPASPARCATARPSRTGRRRARSGECNRNGKPPSTATGRWWPFRRPCWPTVCPRWRPPARRRSAPGCAAATWCSTPCRGGTSRPRRPRSPCRTPWPCASGRSRTAPVTTPCGGRAMERHEILEMMGELKLAGMRAAFDEVLANGVKRQHAAQQIVGDLLAAEIAEQQARSIRYQVAAAKLPLAKELADFDFAGGLINEGLVRELAVGTFLEQQRNAVLVGGTGTGKTHLAVAIARNCIRIGARCRFYTVVDLVNRLEA